MPQPRPTIMTSPAERTISIVLEAFTADDDRRLKQAAKLALDTWLEEPTACTANDYLALLGETLLEAPFSDLELRASPIPEPMMQALHLALIRTWETQNHA